MEKNTMIIAVVAVVAVVAVAGVAIVFMGDDGGDNEVKFDHEGKWVEQGEGAARKLVIEKDELSGWTSGTRDIDDNKYLIYFENDNGFQAIISLTIYDSLDAAKEKYIENKGYAEDYYEILSFEKCEQAYMYDYVQYVMYVFQDLNVYVYFEIQGEVDEQDRNALADTIASLLTEKIHAAAVAIA